LLNSFHSDDAIVGVLATPSRGAEPGDCGEDVSDSILASGDDLGSLCIWRRDRSAPGATHSPAASSTARNGYSWSCVHHAKVGHKISSMSFSPDGLTLAVCTIERAILFDISPVITGTDSHVLSSATDVNSTHKCQIRTVVIDDIVGMHTTDTVFAVDLSRMNVMKVWKITEGFDVNGIGTDISNGHADSRHGSSASDRNTGNIADKVSYLEMGLDQVLKRSDSCVSLSDVFSRTGSPAVQPILTSSDSAPTHQITSDVDSNEDDHSANSQQQDDAKVESGAVAKTDGATNCKEMGESGFCVDPFGYADVFVIDPLRMHLRDWWCDYSSRYLLLGHGRVSALTNFESPGMCKLSFSCVYTTDCF
jgi:hypothetical protein